MNIEQLTGEDIVATELPRKFNGNFANVKQEVESHINNKNNPHKVTAEQLGLASAYIYQGDVETFQNLPTQGVQKGWVYNVKAEFTLDGATYPAGTDVAWDGTKWNTLGGSLKGYVRKVNNVVPDSNANVNVKNLIATKLVNGQDLNNIKVEGRYQCDTDSVASTLLNAPLRTAFYLDVYVNNSSSTQIKQVVTASNATPQVYIRTLVGGTWGSWRAIQLSTTVYNATEIKNTANVPIKLTGSFSHKYTEIAGKDINLASNIDVYWVTPATSDVGVTINLSALTKQSGYSRFVTIYVDGSNCPNLRTITYTNVPSGFTLKNEPERMIGGMVNVIGIEVVGSGNVYTITNNGGSTGAVKQNIEFFNSLQQIGITPGEETFKSIHEALPVNGVLMYYRTTSQTFNSEMYPEGSNYGYVTVTKLNSGLTKFEYAQYTSTANDAGSMEPNDQLNIGVVWETYFNATFPLRPCVWNKHLNSMSTATQTLKSTLVQKVIEDNQDLKGIAEYAGYTKDGKRVGGFQVAKRSIGGELRSRNILYVQDGNDYHSTMYSDWSPSLAKVVTTLNDLVRIPDHIQLAGLDNGNFGYYQLTASNTLDKIPRGNYFFYGDVGDDGTVLANTDVAGLSMRQDAQAWQLCCHGNKLFFRWDDRAAAGVNPVYSAWTEILTGRYSDWTVSKGTNGWARENSTGFTIQWGKRSGVGSASENHFTVTFPRSFTVCYNVVATQVGYSNSNTNDIFAQVTSISPTNFTGWAQSTGEAPWDGGQYWVAIGFS